MKRPSIASLSPPSVAAVARSRSFTRAAAGLGLSSSALSHAKRGLEAGLGVRLVARTTRSVAPTPAGERLLRSLDPALPRFLLDHPAVSVEVVTDDRLTDIVASGFDAGIRFGKAVERDMLAVRVGPDLGTVLVGTPGSFARRPAPGSPADRQDHDCINYRLAGGGLLVRESAKGGREMRVRASGRLVVTDGVLAGRPCARASGSATCWSRTSPRTLRRAASSRCWMPGACRFPATTSTTRPGRSPRRCAP